MIDDSRQEQTVPTIKPFASWEDGEGGLIDLASPSKSEKN